MKVLITNPTGQTCRLTSAHHPDVIIDGQLQQQIETTGQAHVSWMIHQLKFVLPAVSVLPFEDEAVTDTDNGGSPVIDGQDLQLTTGTADTGLQDGDQDADGDKTGTAGDATQDGPAKDAATTDKPADAPKKAGGRNRNNTTQE